ncbi:MAG: ROK family protein [Bacteroidales bacterium]|nr:ROK family protein [Bacteroidales bacterium]
MKPNTEKTAIGIDIGGTNIECAWIDENAQIIHQINFRTELFETAESMVKMVSQAIEEHHQGHQYEQLVGIGIGAPNGNYFTGSIEMAPNLKWKGHIPLAEMFKAETHLPTVLTNDANAAAYAEMLFGGATEMNNFLVVTLGTGLGSGIVVNGEVMYGKTGFAGELGHTIAQANGRPCGCGRKGCLETYVSATGLKLTIGELLAVSRQNSSLRDLTNISAKNVHEAAIKGDALAIKALEYTAKILGQKLTDYITVFSPEAVFLSGGLAHAHSYLIPTIEKTINDNVLPIFKDTTRVYPSKLLEKNAGLLGAAALIMNQ